MDMNYLERHENDIVEHVFFLTSEETDYFFYKFDRNNLSIPSHYLMNRYRFIREDVYEWLITNIGEPPSAWSTQRIIGDEDRWMFLFKEKSQAMMFKLWV